jgi:hypothetical protein
MFISAFAEGGTAAQAIKIPIVDEVYIYTF